MIQRQTILNVTDNSGVKRVMCIGIKGGSSRRIANLGDTIFVAVKKASPTSNIKSGDTGQAIIVRTKKERKRSDGSYIKFDDNAVVMVDDNGEPKGTRVLGPIAREIRNRGSMKIVSQAPEVV